MSASGRLPKIVPPKTRCLYDSRGVSRKIFLNPKFLAKLIFIAFLDHFFRKFANFSQTAPKVRRLPMDGNQES